MRHHLRGLSAQIVLWAILPLSLVLVAVSFGSITGARLSMLATKPNNPAALPRIRGGSKARYTHRARKNVKL